MCLVWFLKKQCPALRLDGAQEAVQDSEIGIDRDTRHGYAVGQPCRAFGMLIALVPWLDEAAVCLRPCK